MNDQPAAPRHQTVAPESFEPSRGQSDHDRLVRRGILGGIFAVLFILAFGAWYLFTGHSVQLLVTPVPDESTLSGGLLRVNLGDRWLLRPGAYRLEAELAGYRPLDVTVTVDDSPDQIFEFPLEKLPGTLAIHVSPDVEATVFIDDDEIGRAPIDGHELAEGSYAVRVEAPRFQPFAAEVAIEGGGLAQRVDYELLPAWGDVTVSTLPAGATLHVDGEPVGETPLTAEILSGRHELEVRLDGYKPATTLIDVVAMQPQTLEPITLEPADHRLRVASVPGGASVTIDGEYRGQTPLQVDLRPGQAYRVGLSLPGYRPNSREVDVQEGDETAISVRLVPVLGTVVVRGAPTDAEVWVDGALRGIAEEPIELPAHPHRLEVRREGFETYRTTVTPNPAVEQVVDARLISEAERRRARTPDLLDTLVGAQLKLFRPSGIFRLGSPRREQGRRSNEFQRQVQLQRPFYVGLTEVTNAQFQRFRAEHDSGVVERETLSLDRQPVVRVSWEDAARFCNWLSEREGLPAAYREQGGRLVPVSPMTTGFRLPTEVEWALVARYGGSTEGRAARRFEWGDELPPPQGAVNVGGREAAAVVETPLANYQDPFPASAQVGQLAPNGAGLYDLGGNVSEWMHDFYTIRVDDSAGGVDPMGPVDGPSHVIRGSSWRSARITELRLAWRGDGTAGADDLGFRLARYAE